MIFFEMTDIIELPGVEYYPFASGHTVENAEVFFQPQGIYHNSFLESTPVFDYFSLISISKEGANESALLDYYEFAGSNYPHIDGLLISEKFKLVLDQFILPLNTMFYPAKLLYHGVKLDYYIFQYTFDVMSHLDYMNSTWQYSNSKFGILNLTEGCTELDFKLTNKHHYYKYILTNTRESQIILKDAYFNDFADIISIIGITRYAISERIKNAIVDANITPALIKPNELINFHFHNGTP